MRVSTERAWALEQSSATRRHLIFAAMRLMADEGIEGVSLRAVNLAAGAKNSSAAHYHFETKLGLVTAIVQTLTEQANQWRAPYVSRLRREGTQRNLTVREVLECAYLPFYGFFYNPDYGLPALKFLSRLIVDTGPAIRPLGNTFTGPLANDVYELVQPILPEIRPKELKSRILFTLVNLINGASDVFSMANSPLGDLTYENPFELANHFLDYLVGGLRSPVTYPDERFTALCTELIQTTSNASVFDTGNNEPGGGNNQ